MASAVCIYIFFMVAVGLILGQLIIPWQACEIQCMKNKGPENQSNITAINECSDYCFKHAYDDLLQLLSSPYPDYLLDTPKP